MIAVLTKRINRRLAKMSNSKSGGIGFVGVLQVAFIVLKLLHKIDWSWIWVLSPIWIWVILYTVIVTLVLISKTRK